MHCPAPIGFWRHPSTLMFARLCREPLAGGYILRVKEFAMLHSEGGDLSPFTDEELAVVAEYPGRPRLFVQHLLRSKALERRGRGRWLSGWVKDPAGRYEERRAYEREYKRLRRAVRLTEAGGGEAPPVENVKPVSTWTKGGRPPAVPVEGGIYLSSNVGRRPPGAPQGGERETADAGWLKFWDAYPRPGNKRRTRSLWDELEAADRAALLAAYPKALDIYRRKNKRFIPYSDKFLRDDRWREFVVVEKAPAKAPPPKVAAKAVAERKRQTELEEQQRERSAEASRRMMAIKDELHAAGVPARELNARVLEEYEKRYPTKKGGR